MKVLHRICQILLIVVPVTISGCLEEKDEFFINPDGSGKVIHEIIVKVKGETTEEGVVLSVGPVDLEDMVAEILTKSSGVDAWADVSCTVTDDGAFHFKGTAFFPDIEKVILGKSNMSTEFGFRFDKTSQGEISIGFRTEHDGIDQGADSDAEPTLADISERDVNKQVAEVRSEYKTMAMLFSGLKIETVMHFPGDIKEISGFEKVGDRSVRIAFDGSKILAVMDERIADDVWVKDQIRQGKNPLGYEFENASEMGKGFLEGKTPAYVVLAPDTQNCFDYQAEIKVARADYEMLLEKLGLAGVVLMNDTEVLSPQLKQVNIIDEYGDKGRKLLFSVKLPREAIQVTEGQVEMTIVYKGTNLVKDIIWVSKIEHPKLIEDKQTCVFDIFVPLFDKRVKTLKHLEGWFKYVTATKSKEIDLGMIRFKKGAKGNKLGAVIKSVATPSVYTGNLSIIGLSVDIPDYTVKSAHFYGEDGTELQIKRQGTSVEAGKVIINYATKQKLPKKGRIVLDVFQDIRRRKVAFRRTVDIPLENSGPEQKNN